MHQDVHGNSEAGSSSASGPGASRIRWIRSATQANGTYTQQQQQDDGKIPCASSLPFPHHALSCLSCCLYGDASLVPKDEQRYRTEQGRYLCTAECEFFYRSQSRSRSTDDC